MPCAACSRHHRLLSAALKRKRDGPWKGLDYDVELELSITRRDQIVVAELCRSFGQPLLRPLGQPWHAATDKHTFDMLFEDTAKMLALFLWEEVGWLEQARALAPAERSPG